MPLTGLLFIREGSVNNRWGQGDDSFHGELYAIAEGESMDQGDLPEGVASQKASLRNEV